VLNFWRIDASEKLGWREKMGWSEGEERELWKGTDAEAYTESFLKWDGVRERTMRGLGHWYLSSSSFGFGLGKY
jgi:hypothetical protein